MPTIAANSGLQDFNAMGWFGAFATAGLQHQLASALNAAVEKALASQPICDNLHALDAEPRNGSASK